MLEIYNEKVKDLLGKGPPAAKKHQISHDMGTTSVSFLESVNCSCPEEVIELLETALSMRSVGEHNLIRAPFPCCVAVKFARFLPRAILSESVRSWATISDLMPSLGKVKEVLAMSTRALWMRTEPESDE